MRRSYSTNYYSNSKKLIPRKKVYLDVFGSVYPTRPSDTVNKYTIYPSSPLPQNLPQRCLKITDSLPLLSF